MTGISVGRTPRQKRETRVAWLFLAPCFLGFLVVRLLPTLFTFVLSLFNWDLIGTPTFAGLDLLGDMLEDATFYRVLSQTFYYVVGCLVCRLVLGLVLSSIFHRGLRGAGLYKSIYFIPVIIPWAAAAVVCSFLFSQDVGPVNYVLNLVGLPSVPWLTSKNVAMLSLIIVSSWKQLGYTTLLLLGGMTSIDQSLYEVSYLNGATSWQRFRYVTFPLLSPTILFVMITEVIFSFQIFDPIYIMTKGGPAGATRTIGYYIYSNAFKRFDFGYAAALSTALFVIIMLLTLLQWYGQKRWVYYD